MKRSAETNIGSEIIITPQEDNHCVIALIQRPKKKKKRKIQSIFLGIHMQVGISNKNREMSEG